MALRLAIEASSLQVSSLQASSAAQVCVPLPADWRALSEQVWTLPDAAPERAAAAVPDAGAQAACLEPAPPADAARARAAVPAPAVAPVVTAARGPAAHAAPAPDVHMQAAVAEDALPVPVAPAVAEAPAPAAGPADSSSAGPADLHEAEARTGWAVQAHSLGAAERAERDAPVHCAVPVARAWAPHHSAHCSQEEAAGAWAPAAAA